MRSFFGEVLGERDLRGVRGPRRALDHHLQAFPPLVVHGCGSFTLVRGHEFHGLVERLCDSVEERILSFVLELVRVGDVAHPRGERGEDHFVFRGDVRAIRGEDEAPSRHELVDLHPERYHITTSSPFESSDKLKGLSAMCAAAGPVPD